LHTAFLRTGTTTKAAAHTAWPPWMAGSGAFVTSRLAGRLLRPIRICSSVGVLAGAVVAASWATLEATLPKPTRAQQVSAAAAGRMLRYEQVDSTFRINGGAQTRGSCIQHWFPKPNDTADRGTLLTLSSGVVLAGVHPRPLVVRRAPRAEPFALRLAQLQLAGCPPTLGYQLAGFAQNDRALRLLDASTTRSGVGLALALPTADGTMTVYLDRSTYQPIAIAIRSPRYRGFSRIAPAAVNPALFSQLDAIRRLVRHPISPAAAIHDAAT
jgi:hypothetical protein